MSNIKFYLIITIAMVMLASCGSKQPTKADFMRQHADDTQALVDLKNKLASQWEKGQEMIKEGEKLVSDGEEIVEEAEKEMKKGNEKIEQGKKAVEEGRKLVEESLKQFRENFPGLELKPE
jgi:uncharacterized phage infection (PIP) family protein YhgE